MANEDKENGADKIARALDFELENKRGEWKRTHERSRTIRQLSLLLFAIVVAGAMVALFLMFNRLNQARSDRAKDLGPAATAP